MGNKHLTEADALLHVVQKNLDSGACLTGHESNYGARNSCSYRYQAVEHARKDAARKALYNKDILPSRQDAERYRRDHGLPAGFIPTSRYKTRDGRKLYPDDKDRGVYPSNDDYGDRLACPGEGDWYVGGPLRADARDSVGKKIPVGENFTTAYWPYWNNAHHMIPQATLNGQITKLVDDVKTRNFVRAGLLQARYNVNHYKNMILLPQDKEVGYLLKLPRHLSLDDGSTEFDPKPKFDHVAYSMKVRMRLTPIINDYKAEAEKVRKKNEECDPRKMTALSKDKLEKLSKDCYDSIMKFGESSPGEPLVDLPDLRPR